MKIYDLDMSRPAKASPGPVQRLSRSPMAVQEDRALSAEQAPTFFFPEITPSPFHWRTY